MICPYCNNEMQPGFITGDGRRGVIWRAEDAYSQIRKVKVAGFNLSAFQIAAQYCDACRKIIIDL